MESEAVKRIFCKEMIFITVNVGDTICYIRHYIEPEDFKVITCKVDSVRIGKKATKAYTKRFNPLDVEELLFNTDWLTRSPTLILVQEPFLATGDLLERAERWCECKGWLHNK